MRRLAARTVLITLAISALAGTDARAHALQPGYLEITHLSGDLLAVLWRVPGVRGRPMTIEAILPEGCDPSRGGDVLPDGAGFTARWTATCPEGLSGGTVTIAGLERTQTDVLVRVDYGDGTVENHRLTPGDPSVRLSGRPSWSNVAATYFVLGVDHILSGVDHLLFVLALALLLGIQRRLFWAITAFTVAHSITLALAALGQIALPPPPVEAVIALSIVFLAVELTKTDDPDGFARRFPWVVAFFFGLVHGLGFAGALKALGLPQSSVPTALLTFNLGVEAGQLLFVAVVLAAMAAGARVLRRHGPAIHTAAAYAIGAVSSYWLIARVAGFW